MIITKTYYNENLTCADCAMQIIEMMEKIEYISEVMIDIDSKEITITSSRTLSIEEVKKFIDTIMLNDHKIKHEHGYIQGIITDEYNFEDIDCPNCAAKVERALNKDENIIEAQVNFVNKKITIKHKDNVEVYNIVSNIVKSVEGDATITCACDHHSHEDLEEEKTRSIKKIIVTSVGIALYIVAIIFHFLDMFKVPTKILFIVSYLLIAYDIIINAIKGVFRKDFFSESSLMIIASLGAVILDEPIEGIMVIILYKVGEYYQDLATNKSKKAIKSLMEIKVDEVMLKDGSRKHVKDVNVGELITIKVGERIPLDGIVKNGATELDMKTLTGESLPVSTKEGEEILSGAINLTRVIDVEVTKKDSESTISKVLKLVEEASNQKSKSEQFITKFSRVYTPCVLIIALIVGLIQYFVFKNALIDTFNNVFTILVISCPCALVISIPLGYFAGIGRASKAGILVKGGNYLEALTKIDSIVFDKTGTITKGNFIVKKVYTENNMSKEDLLKIVSEVEMYSMHPIASSIKNAYGKEIEEETKGSIEEIPGHGLKYSDKDKVIVVGNDKLMDKNNIPYKKCNDVGTILYVGYNNMYYGSIVIGDELKENAVALFENLNNYNYKTVMLTGDNEKVANDISQTCGITKTYSQLMPSQKYDVLKEIIKNKNGTVVYVGDGINDTPSLKLADVGIAMGALGSDSAKEASDIVIMNDDISKIKEAIDIAKRTRKIVAENIVLALTVKVIALIIGITGILAKYGMIIAIFADVGICLLAILNVMRIINYKEKKQQKNLVMNNSNNV